MKMKCFAILSLALMAAACVTAADPVITTSDIADGEYLKKAMDAPLTFSVAKDKAEEVWGRIHAFITKFSPTKIRVSTPEAVETETPAAGMTTEFGYSASQKTAGDQVEFSVGCNSWNLKNSANRNAHFLAYYARTGELIDRLVQR
jgi:hypothetical protein